MSNLVTVDGGSTRNKCTCNWNLFESCASLFGASSTWFRIMACESIPMSTQTEEPSTVTEPHIKSSISNTYQQYYIWQTSPG